MSDAPPNTDGANATPEEIIRVRGLRKIYHVGDVEVPALRGVASPQFDRARHLLLFAGRPKFSIAVKEMFICGSGANPDESGQTVHCAVVNCRSVGG